MTPQVILKGVNKWKARSLSGLSCTTQNVSGLLAQKRPSLWMEDDTINFTGTFCNFNELMDQGTENHWLPMPPERKRWKNTTPSLKKSYEPLETLT